MKTIDLRLDARKKVAQLSAALHDTHYLDSPTAGLAAYHAARACIEAQTRVGFERRFEACRKACKQFRVMVTSYSDDRTGQFVRIHIPTKNIELILGC